MIDFSRTFCDLHPNQLISNFCCKEQCNVGLCATCICSHTQSHIQKRTAPEYENIRTTYSKMQESIRGRITAFQQQKSRINLIIETIQTKRKQISEVIQQARNETMDFVNKFYDGKQKELLRKVQSDQKKVGLHNENRMESLLNLISRDVNSLFASAQDLNSQTFLQSFHRIRTQVLGNSYQTQREIAVQLEKNQSYETNITINTLFITDVKNALQRSIEMVFGEKKPQKESQAKQLNNKSSRATITNNNENSNLMVFPKRSESQMKNSMIAQQQQQPRYQQNPVQPSYNHFLVKQSSQPQLQVVKRSDIFIPNNSMQVPVRHPSQNYGSRIEIKGNSSEKLIKQNLPIRYSRQQLSQNFLDSSFAQANSQFDMSKKIKRSGLTIFKPAENEQKNQ